ncbi:O-antigen ligase family protein [Hyphomonas sp. WL0036]|uniref:O-antigen ligase family protein n=1 Tax=Hyphomonas sediminis TaxID=2866160 RepID=UPI001C82746C|nr:O-antigen ligase family protein [Hyphomonas sediminis]MBY9066366.1 O-antigen ligase family protein [Hyphomonas sediminis]
MAYGPVFAGLLLLWPLLAVLGTLGFAPLLGLTGIAALLLARPRMPPPVYCLFAIAFVGWAAISELWSPASKGLFSGNLLEGNFAIKARSVIVVLTALFAMLTLAGALRSQLTPRTRRWIYGALIVQGVLVFLSAVAAGPVLALIYGTDPNIADGVQNVGRNTNAFAVVLPILAAALGAQGDRRGILAACSLVLLTLLAALMMDNHSTVFAIVGMIGAVMLVRFLPNLGFRWLFGLIGANIAAAPLVMSLIIRGLSSIDAYLPASFRSRVAAWELVMSRVGESPYVGHGLMASRTWRDSYSDFPALAAKFPETWALYPVVPGHPHNMPLQIWAETGLIGAMLAAFAVMTFGFRLPRPADFSPATRYAIAGMAGAVFSIFNFSYSVWNEAFWSGLALSAAMLILLDRSRRQHD